ncbi:MAG: TIGR00282 family metallophosphoesterase [Clostridia bacterium]|nr:TIGR00282 family metallophosphoesterase [Clostridia bacterium]
MTFKILALGDVVGERGTGYLCRPGFLGGIKKEYGVDFTVANGENSAKGNGLTPESARALFDAGVDVITGGNHSWKRNSVYSLLDDDDRIVRPANYPGAAPGHGSTVISAAGVRVLVINLSGNAFMLEPVSSPFECVDAILDAERGRYDVSVVDFHAEATSEKIAMGWYLDGRASAVFGTHTHVQTSDARVLPGGCGYITDLGMCGSPNGVLGVKTDCILHKFTVHTPCRFEEAVGDEELSGAVFEIDPSSGKCLSVRAIRI